MGGGAFVPLSIENAPDLVKDLEGRLRSCMPDDTMAYTVYINPVYSNDASKFFRNWARIIDHTCLN
jgi:hypothetical protein